MPLGHVPLEGSQGRVTFARKIPKRDMSCVLLDKKSRGTGCAERVRARCALSGFAGVAWMEVCGRVESSTIVNKRKVEIHAGMTWMEEIYEVRPEPNRVRLLVSILN